MKWLLASNLSKTHFYYTHYKLFLVNFSGSLLVDVLRRKPDLETELALCLNKETWVTPNWVHLSREVKVDEKVISDLEAYTDRSPTIRLFEHLKSVNESLTIQQLKQALQDIRRDDLYILLTKKGDLY